MATRPASPPPLPPPKQDLFVLFFVPGTARLAPEAEQIVKQAAGSVQQSKVARIEIAVPADTPGGVRLKEGRLTAIQNVLSAAHVDPKLYTGRDLENLTDRVPGATDRAEIRLVP